MSPPTLENMEDIWPMISMVNSPEQDCTNLDPKETQFSDFCKNELMLDVSTYEEARKLIKETKHLLSINVFAIGSGTLCNRTADKAQHGSDDNGITLCQILRTAKLNIVDFFKELPQFVVKAGSILSKLYGTDWESRLEAKELQANFVHLSLLSK